MTDEEKDRKWQEVRDRVLANDAEYQQIVDGYKRGSIVNWIIIIGGAMVGSSLLDFLPVTSVVMKWILSIAAGIVVIVVGLWIRSLFISRKTAEEVEREVRERYFRSQNII
jgi:uncharacterized membrane protein YeaQ/YmgE (transglycosylase-associated protein family)